MKTPYNEIVNIASIGSQTNPISLNEILRKANDEQLTPAAQNKERVLFLGQFRIGNLMFDYQCIFLRSPRMRRI